MKVFRARKKEAFLIIGIDGLISLWVTTIIFLALTLIGWFTAPNIKYEIIKYISYVLFLCTGILHILYGRASKKLIQNDKK